MKDLKVRCTICGKEENGEQAISDVADIIERYNQKSEHYLTLLNVMSGKCLDSDEHSFVFDETFLKEMEEIVKKHKDSLLEVEKLKNVNVGLKKEADELAIKIQELQSKHESNKERIRVLHESIVDYENEVEDSTGSKKIDIWY